MNPKPKKLEIRILRYLNHLCHFLQHIKCAIQNIGLVNVIFVCRNKCSVCGRRVRGVREVQGAQGQLPLSKGPEWMGNSPP